MTHRTPAELADREDYLAQAPVGVGTLRMIVRRPDLGQREILTEGELDVAEGLLGDSWKDRSSKRTADGSPHPDMQLNVMSWRVVEALADTDEQRAMAGDQLYVDLALGGDVLPPGTVLSLGTERGGTAQIVVTDQPHTGCAKFVERFGEEAMRWVNGRQGRAMNRRGINARVLTPGVIRPGDTITAAPPA